MKNIINLFATVSIFGFLSCSCEKQENEPSIIIDKDGVVLKQPYLWKTSLTNTPYIGTFVYPSLIWNDKMIFGAETNNTSELALLNIETGEKVWQKPYAPKENAAMSGSYQYNNIAIIDAENALFSGFNIETGEILWSLNPEGWFWSFTISGIDNTFFICGASAINPKPYEISAAWFGNIETGEAHEIWYPDFGTQADTCYNVVNYNRAGGVERVIPYKSVSGEVFLVIYYRSVIHGPRGEDYFSLYNFTKKEFVYQDIKLSWLCSGSPIVKNDKLFFTLYGEVCCYDLYSGVKLWGKLYPSGFSNGGFIVEEGKLYAMEDIASDDYLMCLDVNNGNQLWKTPSKQLDAPIRYLNGVIYFVPLSDAKLHAYEASTGKELWRIESPDYAHDSGAFFKPECTVVPGKNGEKGKVIVSSYLNGFCYEAAR